MSQSFNDMQNLENKGVGEEKENIVRFGCKNRDNTVQQCCH